VAAASLWRIRPRAGHEGVTHHRSHVRALNWHVDLHFDAIDLPEMPTPAGQAAGALHHGPHGPRESWRTASINCRSAP